MLEFVREIAAWPFWAKAVLIFSLILASNLIGYGIAYDRDRRRRKKEGTY